MESTGFVTSQITVSRAPALARIANVELIHTGTWQLSTGPATFTTDDLTDAVTALQCSAVRRPILKLGHCDPRFDGEPCVGWVDNLAVADDGRTLVGDYAGMPGWLGTVLASAYPDRSIEGQYDYQCQMGHIHPFVVQAVALLGVSAPGIGSLESLQDVATLYGVVATGDHVATDRSVVVHVKGSSPVSGTPVAPPVAPSVRQVTATVTAEDVMRAFYASPLGSDWDSWVEELHIDPLQLIYVNDADSTRARVPVIVGTGEGSDAVSFGDPVSVLIRYVDAVAALPPSGNVIKFAYRSRPNRSRIDVTAAAIAPGERISSMDDTQLVKMRTALDLAADADEATVVAAAVEKLTTPDQPSETPLPALPDGTVAVDKAQFDNLVAAAARGERAAKRQEREDREKLVSAAIHDGRIAPIRKEHWLTSLEKDPGSEAVLASLAPGLIPVTEIGHGGSANTADDELYVKLWGAPVGMNLPANPQTGGTP